MIDHEKLIKLVNEQAEDESLWFHAHYVTEDVLMRALRRLHAAIEGDWELADKLRIDND
jgi:hypothetical protein